MNNDNETFDKTNAITNFNPPDWLLDLLPDFGLVCGLTNYINYIEQLPVPFLPTAGLEGRMITDIQKIQNAMDLDFPFLKSTAKEWYTDIRPPVLEAIASFQFFAENDFESYYKPLEQLANVESSPDVVAAIKEKVKEWSDEIDVYHSKAKIAYSNMRSFSADLAKSVTHIQDNYKSTKAALTELTSYATKIESHMQTLQQQIKDNNKEVASTAKNGLKKMMSASIEIGGQIGAGKEADAIKSGAILAVEEAENATKIITLSVESMELLTQIDEDIKKLNVVENDLLILNDVTTQMASITYIGDEANKIIQQLESFWEKFKAHLNTIPDKVAQGKYCGLDILPEIMISTWYNGVYTILSSQLESANSDVSIFSSNDVGTGS